MNINVISTLMSNIFGWLGIPYAEYINSEGMDNGDCIQHASLL